MEKIKNCKKIVNYYKTGRLTEVPNDNVVFQDISVKLASDKAMLGHDAGFSAIGNGFRIENVKCYRYPLQAE